jgi:hypothetical protein
MEKWKREWQDRRSLKAGSKLFDIEQVTTISHVCFCPCRNFLCAFYRLPAHLAPSPPLGFAGHCPACGDRGAATCWDGDRGRWRGGRFMVHIHFRIARQRHSGALRSASPADDSGSLPFRPQSYVHGCRTRPHRRRPLLRVVAAPGLCGPLPDLSPYFRAGLYEEPTLRRTIGQDYEAYCHHVCRWLPSLRTAHDSDPA